MNIQERIREQKSKYSTLTASNEKDLVEVSIQLLDVQLYLDKPSEDWTPEEKDKFGSKEQLRKKEAQLLKNEEQLLKNEELLLQIKLNQMQRTQGKVLSVSINQSRLLNKYITPANSVATTPVENSPTHDDISTLGLKLEQAFFFKNTTSRPCIVVDVKRDYDWSIIGSDPPITIVLITGFDGKDLTNVMAEDEFKRVMPIAPSSAQRGTAEPLRTTPEWTPHTKRKTPSYVLCIPLMVYPQNLKQFEDSDSVHLDDQNLEKLKVHILSLGGISANADFVDLEEDSDDDDFLGIYKDTNRFITWDEIVV